MQQRRAGSLQFRYHQKMRLKKSDFLEKSDFSNYGKEIRFFEKVGFINGTDIFAFLY